MMSHFKVLSLKQTVRLPKTQWKLEQKWREPHSQVI